MIKIIDVDYTDICSCCDDKVKIVKMIDSIYSSIDFCENCWNEFIEELKKENYIQFQKEILIEIKILIGGNYEINRYSRNDEQ